jgi:hypothetical protein
MEEAAALETQRKKTKASQEDVVCCICGDGDYDDNNMIGK